MKADKKINILITGASGFVGRALVEELLKKGGDSLFLTSRDRKFKVSGAKIFYGDLSDQKFCQKIIKDIDVVYYLAGFKKNIAHHIKYPNDFVVGNVEPLISFLKAVKESSAQKIIYLSSTNAGLYKEEETDGYVLGKYINELILKSFAKQADIDIKIVRSVGIYGPGDNFNPETANFIPNMINQVYQGRGEILVWGTGQREMQFIFVDDLISNLMAIALSQEKFFTVGNPEKLTVNDIVQNIIKISGKNLAIKNDPSKPDKSTQLFQFNNLKNPDFDFDKGLKKTINYYKINK